MTLQVVAGESAVVDGHGDAAGHAAHGRRADKLRFALHFLEMQVSMSAGMVIGGALGIGRVQNTELCAALWLLAMTLPMVAWMTLRGMRLRSSSEMSVAMAVPVVLALPFLWTGVIPRETLIGIEHMSMAPGMLALMLIRRSNYWW